jgi:hypothetical protein
MDPNLLLGALLVGVGLALAALAYSLITERTSADKETEEDTPAKTTEEVSLDETSSTTTVELADPDNIEDTTASDEELPTPEGEPEAETEEAVAEIEDPREEPKDEPEPIQDDSTPKPEPPKIRPTFPVATLMRDEVTGELVIQVGDETYRNKEELQSSKNWGRVQFAAEDLAKWMVGDPTGEVSEPSPPARRIPSGKAERKESDAPRSMVEEIDEILQDMLEDSNLSERAVRLMEGPGGMATVLIGIDSYAMEDVPDPEIKDLIKQAVATWEATR